MTTTSSNELFKESFYSSKLQNNSQLGVFYVVTDVYYKRTN